MKWSLKICTSEDDKQAICVWVEAQLAELLMWAAILAGAAAAVITVCLELSSLQ